LKIDVNGQERFRTVEDRQFSVRFTRTGPRVEASRPVRQAG
jgi:hypothetical protein